MSSSALLNKLIESLQIMPGIGPVSASRIAYYLLARKRDDGLKMAECLKLALTQISRCPLCRNYSDDKDCVCKICANRLRRSSALLCVVESPSDVEAIEQSSSFNGTYFVLHGRLSPIDGIGPKELGLDLLKERLQSDPVKELILAVSQTVEGDATASYIASFAKNFSVKVTRIASGVPVGGDLVNVDGNTLANSLNFRRPM